MVLESHPPSILPAVALIAAVAYLLYGIGLVVYRLYFHPLAKFPGSRLAAVTYWYEAYYEIVKTGKFTFKISELHDKYGMSTTLIADWLRSFVLCRRAKHALKKSLMHMCGEADL